MWWYLVLKSDGKYEVINELSMRCDCDVNELVTGTKVTLLGRGEDNSAIIVTASREKRSLQVLLPRGYEQENAPAAGAVAVAAPAQADDDFSASDGSSWVPSNSSSRSHSDASDTEVNTRRFYQSNNHLYTKSLKVLKTTNRIDQIVPNVTITQKSALIIPSMPQAHNYSITEVNTRRYSQSNKHFYTKNSKVLKPTNRIDPIVPNVTISQKPTPIPSMPQTRNNSITDVNARRNYQPNKHFYAKSLKVLKPTNRIDPIVPNVTITPKPAPSMPQTHINSITEVDTRLNYQSNKHFYTKSSQVLKPTNRIDPIVPNVTITPKSSPTPSMQQIQNSSTVIDENDYAQRLVKLINDLTHKLNSPMPNIRPSVSEAHAQPDSTVTESYYEDYSSAETMETPIVKKEKKQKYKNENDYGETSNTKENEWVPIGSGTTLIHKDQYRKINWTSYTKATRTLLLAAFPKRILATHSMTGKKSPAFPDKPVKLCLDQRITEDIVLEITDRFGVKKSSVRSIITTKCADECKMMKVQQKKAKADLNSKKYTKETEMYNSKM